MATAIMVDGGFFLRRYRFLKGHTYDARQVAKDLFTWSLKHLEGKNNELRELYRIFYYDCPPLQKKIFHPLTKELVDLGKSEEAQFRLNLHSELRKLRKVALRQGRLGDYGNWIVEPFKLKKLVSGTITAADLKPEDVSYEVRQKGVDMRIGLDISSLTYKKQVDQIVLIAGDADFVPAAKMARREGIDFILDPMWKEISDELHEHIDGLKSTCPRPGVARRNAEAAEAAAHAHAHAHAHEEGSHGPAPVIPPYPRANEPIARGRAPMRRFLDRRVAIEEGNG
ncbi:MAG: NYN domain-containing protein [Acidobacteria bacterium]|nr:NYN domain-containing protein [Acidobacteriota bacterium]